MPALPPLLDAVAGPLLWGLRLAHGWVGTWPGALSLLALALAAVLLGLAALNPRGWSAVARARALVQNGQAAVSEGDAAATAQRAKPLTQQPEPGWYRPVGWILSGLRIAVLAYAYVGLLGILLHTADLRGAPLLWLPDLTQRDPWFALPLILLLTGAIGIWLRTEDRSPKDRRRPLGLALAWLLGKVVVFALLPGGLAFFALMHLAIAALLNTLIAVFALPRLSRQS